MAPSLVSTKGTKTMAKSVPTKVTRKKNSPPVQLSAEYIQDSDDGEEVRTLRERSNPSPAKATPVKRKANGKIKNTITPNNIKEQSEEESEEEESEEESGVTSESSSGEEEEGDVADEEEDPESEEEVENGVEEEGASSSDAEAQEEEPGAARAKNAESAAGTPRQVPKPRSNVSPYNPPKGFLEQDIDAELHFVKAFQGLGTKGKQIWHIEAPASVDISSLRQLTLEGIKTGKPVLSHGDNQYAFVQDLSENRRSTNAIIPSTQGCYRATPQLITQTLRLQLVVPDHATSAHVAGVKKPVRQQPENLKQRFQPLGAKRKRVKTPKLEKAKKVKISN